jgi:uncharacterized damage-inducible protein DinB
MEMMSLSNRPEKGEYNNYYTAYVNLVPNGDIFLILDKQIQDTVNLCKDISDNQGLFRYAPNKWSFKEVIGHMTDTERIMSYRLLCIARGEKESLPGFDENVYVNKGSFDKQSIHDLLESLTIVRQSTLHLLKSLDDQALLRQGSANNSEVTVRALAYIIAGHELHHRQILKERYISSPDFPTN